MQPCAYYDAKRMTLPSLLCGWLLRFCVSISCYDGYTPLKGYDGTQGEGQKQEGAARRERLLQVEIVLAPRDCQPPLLDPILDPATAAGRLYFAK